MQSPGYPPPQPQMYPPPAPQPQMYPPPPPQPQMYPPPPSKSQMCPPPQCQMYPPQSQPAIVTGLPLGPESARMTCPYCHYEISTVTQKETRMMAYVCGAIIALCGCVCGCCLIPCCMDSCKNTEHFCPQCQAYLGVYKKLRW